MMKIYEAKDYQENEQKSGEHPVAQVILKPDCVLGLATGVHTDRYIRSARRLVRERRP